MVIRAGNANSIWERLALSKRALYLLVTLFLFFIFGFKDALVLLDGRWPHLYATINTPVLSWEEISVYLPFANHFSLTTPLPAAPMARPDLSHLTNFPPITLVLQGILFRWLFAGNVDLYLLALHTVLPTAAFWTLFLIYRRYIAESWSLLLAFWGVTYLRNFSSLGYLFGLLTGQTELIAGASLSPPEVTRMPAPALTFFLFALTFYLTTRPSPSRSDGPTRHSPLAPRHLLYTFLWALHAYIYLFNFIAGLLFWFGYLIFRRVIADRGWRWPALARTLLANGLVVTAVLLPILLRQLSATPLDREILQRMGLVVAHAGPISSEWGFLLAYILPLAAVLFVAWASYADYYELIYRFAPVFLMIAVELIILNLHLILGQFVQPYLFSVRIGNFFTRYLYFIPIIYFISHPPKRRFHHPSPSIRGRLSQLVAAGYRAGVDFLLRWQQVVAFLGMVLIALVIVTSSLKYARHHHDHVAPAMQQTAAHFQSLLTSQSQPGLLASEEISVNLLLPALSPHATLLVSSFNNYLPEAEILDRLLLFGHIFNWDEDQFLTFMLPNPLYDTFYTDNDFTLSAEVLQNGFGYWLLHHRRQMAPAELASYQAMLSEQFAGYDVRAGAARYGLTAVQATNPINPQLPFQNITVSGDTVIYQLTTP
jgi:hypothetical protein